MSKGKLQTVSNYQILLLYAFLGKCNFNLIMQIYLLEADSRYNMLRSSDHKHNEIIKIRDCRKTQTGAQIENNVDLFNFNKQAFTVIQHLHIYHTLKLYLH